MKTLTERCVFEAVIRRSRFIAHAGPVASEAETLRFFEAVAEPAATHNCWAWRLDGRYRFSDDGEPAGTAGRPIMTLLEGRGLDRIMVVVVRYYGGIQLGVGGLARAYAGTTAKALDQGEFEPIVVFRNCELAAPFEAVNTAHQVLGRHGLAAQEERFDETGVRLVVRVPSDRVAGLAADLGEASRGAIRLWRLRA